MSQMFRVQNTRLSAASSFHLLFVHLIHSICSQSTCHLVNYLLFAAYFPFFLFSGLSVRLRVHHKMLIISPGLMGSILLGKGAIDKGLLGGLFYDYQLSMTRQNFSYELGV